MKQQHFQNLKNLNVQNIVILLFQHKEIIYIYHL